MTEHDRMVFKMNKEKEEKAKLTAKAISDFVNSYGNDHDAFILFMMQDHRTLQQSTMRLFLKVMGGWAASYKNGVYDDRNKATCKLCADIQRVMNERDPDGWDYLPMI